jgi:CubicO group peptidase (beta-lactamase class C family)
VVGAPGVPVRRGRPGVDRRRLRRVRRDAARRGAYRGVRRTQLYDTVGTYGWSGGLGTTWINDPAENLTLILLTQRAWTSHLPPAICRDFLTTAYQALED